MNTAKDRVVFFDSMADDVCATIRASWCEGLDCTFEAIECVGAAIHGYLERLVVIVPASFAFRHGGLRFRGLRLMPVHYSRLSESSGIPHCHLGDSPVRYETPISAAAHTSTFVRNQKVSVPVGPGPFTNGTTSQRKMPRNTRSVSHPCQVAGTQPQPYALRLNQYCSGLSFR